MLRNNLLPLHLAALHKQFASIIISIRILYGGQVCYFYILIKSFGILKIQLTNGKRVYQITDTKILYLHVII